MINFYEDLFVTTGLDGAFAPVGIEKDHDGVDLDTIMEAWFRERRESIECGIFLDQARKLLTRILIDEDLTPRNRRRIRGLIRAIKQTRS